MLSRAAKIVIAIGIIAAIIAVLFILIILSVKSKTPTTTTTTCNVSCPPGYEVNPLTCECSRIIPANIIIPPQSPKIGLWLAASGGLQNPTSCYLNNLVINIGKACMGVLPPEYDCCPPAPQCPCQYCDPSYGCNPEQAQTQGSVSIIAQVVSSNGTPVPNTTIIVQPPFSEPKVYYLKTCVETPGGPCCWGVVKLTLYPPATSVTTDINGNASVIIPFKAELTYFSPASLDVCELTGGQFCFAYFTENLKFNFIIPDTAIYVPAVIPLKISLCANWIT